MVWQKFGTKSQPLRPWLERLSCRIFVEHFGRVTDSQPSCCLKTDELAQTEQQFTSNAVVYAPALMPVQRERHHDLRPCFSKLQKGDEAPAISGAGAQLLGVHTVSQEPWMVRACVCSTARVLRQSRTYVDNALHAASSVTTVVCKQLTYDGSGELYRHSGNDNKSAWP